jgi:hypothetical protein
MLTSSDGGEGAAEQERLTAGFFNAFRALENLSGDGI